MRKDPQHNIRSHQLSVVSYQFSLGVLAGGKRRMNATAKRTKEY